MEIGGISIFLLPGYYAMGNGDVDDADEVVDDDDDGGADDADDRRR